LKDVWLAWSLAERLELGDHSLWSDLAREYEAVDPVAVLMAHRDLVEVSLVRADAAQYRRAARRLRTMRRIAARIGQADVTDEFIAALREENRRQARLQAEIDKAGLP
jgi:hypothetical protein